MRPPGTLLLAIAKLLFDDTGLSRVVHPTIADLQEEVRLAGTDRRRRLLARWRGYRAFWVLMLASPIAFWSWPMTPHTDRRALLNVSGLIVAALVVVAVLTASAAMVRFDYVFEGLPDVVSGLLGDVHTMAFIAGPAALVLLFAFRGLGGPVRFTVRPAEATLLTLLSGTVAVTTGPVVFGNAFSAIASGRAPAGHVVEIGVLSLEALMYAAGAVTACLLVVTALTIRAAREGSTSCADQTRMPARLAVALAAVMGLTIVAVHLLLRSYSRYVEQVVSFGAPGRRVGSIDSVSDTADLLAHNSGLLFVGGGVLTWFLVVAGVLTWRVSRTRTPHAILAWASRVALAIVIVGAWWHGGQAGAALDAYRELPQVGVPGPPAANRM